MKQIYLLLLLLLSASTFAQEKGWSITAKESENYTGVVVANGRIGILPTNNPFEVEHVMLNNVYETINELDISRIIKGMNFGNLDLEIDGEKITKDNISDWKQTLNMKEAYLECSFIFKKKAEILYRIYTLRNIQYTAYIDINIKATQDIDVKATGKILIPEKFKQPLHNFNVLLDYDSRKTMPVLQSIAKTEFNKHTVATAATFVWHNIPTTDEKERPKLIAKQPTAYENTLAFTQNVKKGEALAFAWTGAECTTQDFVDPQSEAERFVINNMLTPKIDLLAKHNKLWAELWEGDIIIEGDLNAQLDIRLALYHLYAFGRGDSDLSISPMGLSSQKYNGHIFWDTEIWMYPPLLLLNNEIARSLCNYRYNLLPQAKTKAVNYGYKGAMFPWESDDTGEEATPTWALTGPFEHHITADIAIAFWNYYRVTKDKNWLINKGFPLMKEVGDYWVSRSTQNADDSYSINNVVGANEFAANIDDNAFTNGAAKVALGFITDAAKELDLSPNPDWMKVANGLMFHKFDDGVTKENKTYNGEEIKQADVNLLAYPLNVITDKETLIKDLKYYEPKLAHDGPAMGKAIFSIIYARLGDAENAYRLFNDAYIPNKREPFGALSETVNSNASYFATGAGGLLQAVLFGFGGLHITDSGIVQKNPILPKAWKKLTIKGIGADKKTYVVE